MSSILIIKIFIVTVQIVPRRTRAELLERIEETLRKVSAQSVLISDLVAKKNA